MSVFYNIKIELQSVQMRETKKAVEQERHKREAVVKQPPPSLSKLIKRIQLLPPNVSSSNTAKQKIEWKDGRIQLQPPNANLPPLNVRSIDASDWHYSTRSNRYKSPREQWTEEARWSLYKNLEDLPKEFQEYIWGADAVPEIHHITEVNDPDFDISKCVDSTLQAVVRYEDFCTLQKQFHYTAVFAFRSPSWEQQFKNSKREEPSKQMRYMLRLHKEQVSQFGERPLPFLVQTRIKINNDGSIEPVPDKLLEALSERHENGEKVDVRRIRECAVCNQIFWAGRVEKFYCSEKCKTNLNSTLNRKNKTEEERKKDNDQKANNRTRKNKRSSNR